MTGKKANQGFGLLEKNATFVVEMNKSYKIVPVSEDNTLMSKEAFFAKIDRAAQSIKEGKGKTVHSKEELLAYLDSL
ncbi:MAG: prevent-host-death protein [Tannerellaceae bacterium]|jgi:hypothetical protein|nr:prevent-host-death protein [Tannerellaceae bacterium]